VSVQVSHRGNVWSDKKPRKEIRRQRKPLTVHTVACTPCCECSKHSTEVLQRVCTLYFHATHFPPQVLKSDPRLWDVNQLHPAFLNSMCSTSARDRMSTRARLEAFVMYIDMHVNAIYRQMCIGRHAYIGYMQVYRHTPSAVCTWNESRKIPLMLQTRRQICTYI